MLFRSHLTRSDSSVQYPIGEARGGIRYRFIPASMLLTNSLRDVRIFHSKDDAEKFVRSLQWVDAGSEATPKTHPRPTADSSDRARREKTDDLIDKMAKGEIVVAKEIVSATPPEPTAVETSASGPGNRTMTLGPHVGEAENQKNPAKEGATAESSKPIGTLVPGMDDAKAEKVIEQALVDQKEMLVSKKEALNRWNENDQAHFEKWFGVKDEAARKAIQERVDKMLELNKTYTVKNFQGGVTVKRQHVRLCLSK